MRSKLREIKEELRRRRHASIDEQGHWLGMVVRGYFAYSAVPTNSRALFAFRRRVSMLWLHSLRRRSQRHRLPWTRMRTLVDRFLPPARILHPWPERRFRLRHSKEEPYARIGRVRISSGCALQAHVIQLSEMATAVKPSQQPCTEFCVVPGNGHCEA